MSGNKLRKLKYNLLEAKHQQKEKLLTFGGAFSNHIAATAFAGQQAGFETIGIIRGDELEHKINKNPTLLFAKKHGMKLEFISRESYRLKNEKDFLFEIQKKYTNCYILPEGGTNDLAIKGCEEILTSEDQIFDYICCSVGTAGTIAGIVNSSFQNQTILAFPALKGDFVFDDIESKTIKKNWMLESDYHFGGYAKISSELITFINKFFKTYEIPLDPVYTGKMMFGVFDKIAKNEFPDNSKILVIHTGGLQGIDGMNLKLLRLNEPLIQK